MILTFAAPDDFGEVKNLGWWRSLVAHPAYGGRVAGMIIMMGFYVYIIFSSSLNKYYCGHTDNFVKRLSEHNAGKGNFTSKGIPWNEIKTIALASRPEAMKLENQIKERGIKRYLSDLE